MLARLSAVFFAVLLATSVAGGTVLPRNHCDTGHAQCCNSVKDASSPEVEGLLGGPLGGLLGLLDPLLGGILANVPLTGLVGLQCSPLNIVGGSGTCDQTAVCCKNNNVGGLISIGCIPLIL